jgi:ATP-dependent Clp protease protease subunit
MNTTTVVEQSVLGDRQWDIFSRLMKDRIVFISGNIDDDLANTVVGQLLFLEKESSTDPIYLYINSNGGYVDAGLAVLDTMRYVACPVYTICVGKAMSMAAILLSAGAKGNRACLEHSRVMLHQPIGGAFGQASDVLIQADEMRKMKKILIKIISDNTGVEEDTVERDVDRDFYLSAQEALEYGLIDKIIKK